MTLARRAWWRRKASPLPVIHLVAGFETARTPVEQLALAELSRREEMTLPGLVTSTVRGLVAQEIGRCGSAVDIGISGPMVFHAAVVRELHALEGVLWRYLDRPRRPSEPRDGTVPWRRRQVSARWPMTLTT